MKTRVQFYHNTSDPLALACELVGKAYAGGRHVALRVADDEMARQLDRRLWSFEQLSFIPHVMRDAPLASETPVLIGRAHDTGPWPHNDLLFNLAQVIPEGFDAFRMVIEIVGQSEAEKNPARARWMQYKSSGAPLQAFDSIRREAI